jgi:hypothetical protein
MLTYQKQKIMQQKKLLCLLTYFYPIELRI